MLVTPRPGVNRNNQLETLWRLHSEVFNLRSGGGPTTAHKRLLAYLKWTSNAVRMLGSQVSPADLDRLVLTERYKLLLAGVGTMTSTEMEAGLRTLGICGTGIEHACGDLSKERVQLSQKRLDRRRCASMSSSIFERLLAPIRSKLRFIELLRELSRLRSIARARLVALIDRVCRVLELMLVRLRSALSERYDAPSGALALLATRLRCGHRDVHGEDGCPVPAHAVI